VSDGAIDASPPVSGASCPSASVPSTLPRAGAGARVVELEESVAAVSVSSPHAATSTGRRHNTTTTRNLESRLMPFRVTRCSAHLDAAWRAQLRLHRRWTHLDESRGKRRTTVAVAAHPGIGALPVGVALEAKKRGVKTIGLTSVEYSSQLPSAHPSGKHLYEVCDLVLDECAPVGDALVHVDELNVDMCPASGISASYINWALQAEIVEILVSQGKVPSIYISNHMPNAGKINAESWKKYEKQGY